MFVDGVQRIDARVWIEDDDGASRQGVCASWAAGVVRCDGPPGSWRPRCAGACCAPATASTPSSTRHGDYRAYPVPDAGGDPLGQALGRVRGDLEGRVAVESGPDRDLLVVDGPLGDRRHIDGAVGYVKAPPRGVSRGGAAGGGRAAGRR